MLRKIIKIVKVR